MSDNEPGPRNSDRMDQMDCANLPDEIFEHHIWKHFSCNQWIRVFSLVCKKWKRICEESTVDPKQIRIGQHRIYDTARYIQIVKKYQPTILRMDLALKNKDVFLVHRICEASKRLHTLVLERRSYHFDMYVKPIKHITTLALKTQGSDNFWKNLGTIFPNLKRLQIEDPPKSLDIKVDHLTLIHRRDSSLEKLTAMDPDVIVSQRDNLIITKLGSGSERARELTYEEYFKYFGQTELYTVLTHFEYRDFKRAEELFGSGTTTMEYEKQLYDSDIDYEYPLSISLQRFDQTAYWSRLISSSEAYDNLVRTNLIPVPSWKKFIALCNFKRKKEALEEFCNFDKSILMDRYDGSEVRYAFFEYLLPHATKAELHQKSVIENVKEIVRHPDVSQIELKDLKKIQDLRDWSKYSADTTDVRTCHAMVAIGCKISGRCFKELSEKEDVSCIIDLIAKQDPSKFVGVLAYYSLDELKYVINKYNISITLERDGVALFNKRIRLFVVTKEELNEYKHLVNHMDSSGRTPLLAALQKPHSKDRDKVCPTVHQLLKLGADPTKHRGDKLSPLGLLIEKCCHQLECNQIIDIINLLVEYGADVNAPCLFKERMCSPLMIAVLLRAEQEIISYLLALGCRTNYVDETGRTIMDCMDTSTDKYYKKEVTQLFKVYQ